MKRALRALAATSIILSASPAVSAVIVKSLQFDATTGGPISSHSGSFTIQYDDVTNAATLLDVDFAIGSTDFTVLNTGLSYAGNDVSLGRSYFIGGTPSGVRGITSGINDFIFHFNPYTVTGGSFSYSTVGYNNIGDGSGSLSAAVPEPSAWAMLLIGFFALGYAQRRRSVGYRAAYAA